MNREKLIDVALSHYAKRGYHGATMRSIANEVGIKPASIYFFYQNKETLFIAAFKKVLTNHLEMMHETLENNKEQTMDQIFSAILHSIVQHHQSNMSETISYISLVISPIAEITTHLQEHMKKTTMWLEEEFESHLKSKFQNIQKDDVTDTIQKFNVIANGIFWGINLYDEETLVKQLQLSEDIFKSITEQLSRKYNHRNNY